MNPRDMFIKYLVSNGYIEEELLEQASKKQEEQGGEILDILLDILMHQREQMQFVENLSTQNPEGKRIKYVSSAENQIPPLLQSFLEYSKTQEEGEFHQELVPTAALAAPELPSLPQESHSSPSYYSSPKLSDMVAQQSHGESYIPLSKEMFSSQSQPNLNKASQHPVLPKSSSNRLVTTVSRENWQGTKPDSSEFPLDDELLRYADAFQTLFDPRVPHFLMENQKGSSKPDDEGFIEVVGIEVPGNDPGSEMIDDVADFLEEVHASSDMLLSGDYDTGQAVSYHDVSIAPPSPSGYYEEVDPYGMYPRPIGSQDSLSALIAFPEPEPSNFIPHRINGSQDSLDALPAVISHGSHDSLPSITAKSQGSIDGIPASSRSKISLDGLPVASSRSYPEGPSSPSYQSIHGLSSRKIGKKIRKNVASRDALLAASSCDDLLASVPDQWSSRDDIPSIDNAPRGSSHHPRTFSSYEMMSPSQAGLISPSQAGLVSPSREMMSGSQNNLYSASQNNLYSGSQNNLYSASQNNLYSASHHNLIGPSQDNLLSASQNKLRGVSYRSISGISYNNLPTPSRPSISYEIAPVFEPPAHTHYSKPELLIVEDTGSSWKWFAFFLLSFLTICALVGGALSYHKFINKSVDKAPIQDVK